MATTGANLLVGFSDFIDDNVSGTTTGAGNSGGTTVLDSALGKFGDGRLSGRYMRITSGTDALAVRRITDNAQSTGTVITTGVPGNDPPVQGNDAGAAASSALWTFAAEALYAIAAVS